MDGGAKIDSCAGRIAGGVSTVYARTACVLMTNVHMLGSHALQHPLQTLLDLRNAV